MRWSFKWTPTLHIVIASSISFPFFQLTVTIRTDEVFFSVRWLSFSDRNEWIYDSSNRTNIFSNESCWLKWFIIKIRDNWIWFAALSLLVVDVLSLGHVQYSRYALEWNAIIVLENGRRLKPMSWRCSRCRAIAIEGNSIDLDSIHKWTFCRFYNNIYENCIKYTSIQRMFAPSKWITHSELNSCKWKRKRFQIVHTSDYLGNIKNMYYILNWTHVAIAMNASILLFTNADEHDLFWRNLIHKWTRQNETSVFHVMWLKQTLSFFVWYMFSHTFACSASVLMDKTQNNKRFENI